MENRELYLVNLPEGVSSALSRYTELVNMCFEISKKQRRATAEEVIIEALIFYLKEAQEDYRKTLEDRFGKEFIQNFLDDYE